MTWSLTVQKEVCAALEKEETSDQKFFVDKWQRKEVQLCEFRLIVYVFVPSLCTVCVCCDVAGWGWRDVHHDGRQRVRARRRQRVGGSRQAEGGCSPTDARKVSVTCHITRGTCFQLSGQSSREKL